MTGREWDKLIRWALQNLDNKTLSRLEAAVAKSAYVGPGKKLKVTNEVRPVQPNPPPPNSVATNP